MEGQLLRVKRELKKINQLLEELMSKGANDEKLVSRKRELETLIRDTCQKS